MHYSNALSARQSNSPENGANVLSNRYGAAALEDGFTAIPCVVLKARRALGITAPEWDFVCELFSHWRSARDPFPAVDTLAAGMGVDASTIRRHRLALEHKGLLRVYRIGYRQCYDLRPLISAAVEHRHTEERTSSPAQGTSADVQQPRANLHTEEKILEETYDQDRTPYPQMCSSEDAIAPASVAGVGNPDTASAAAALASRIDAIGEELGDDTPRSSVTRALNLQAELGAAPDIFLAAIDAAARIVRERAPTIHVLGTSGRPNGMHYFFAVLRRDLTGVRNRPHERKPRRRPAEQGVPVRTEPALIMEANSAWHAVLDDLRQVLTPENFNRWFARTHVISQDGDLLHVAVPALLDKQWLENRLAGRITAALQRADFAGVRVEYVVEDLDSAAQANISR